MGRGHSGVHRVGGDDGISLLRQADATAHVGDIRSDGGTDGRRRGRGVGGLSDICLVGLSALVSAGIVSVDLLVPVSATGHVAEDVAARRAAMLVGSIVVGGSTMLMLPISVFLSIYSVLMACMTASLMQTMMRHQRNQQKPEVLREDMFHQVRNLAQPLVMVVPMLYAGMLLGGVPALEGLLVTLLLIAASFVANILAGVIALRMIKKNKAFING